MNDIRDWMQGHGLFAKGLRVYISPILGALPVPVIPPLSEEVCVSPDFRSDFNQWLLDTFGAKQTPEIIWSHDAIGDLVYVSQRVYDALKHFPAK